ncbi:MAG: glycosyltransferase [Solirubrobacterales bacterium]|nr:glycosyltransferase [Solirubrobacterales bacterium]
MADRRLRVLFVMDHVASWGGAERFAAGLAAHMPREEIEPWLCCTRSGDDHAVSALLDAGVRYVSLGRRAKWDVHRLLPLFDMVRRERFDVIHSHMFGSNVWSSLAGRACRVPVIIAHEHNWSYTGDRLRMWLDGHLISRFATCFVAVSEANRQRMIKLEGVPAETIKVIPTAYVPHLGPVDGNIRDELGLSAEVPVIGVAAVMRKEKALEVMLDAHARLLGRLPAARLVIAGDGPCRPALEHQIDRLGIAANVHLLGRRNDVDQILQGVDVGALCSDWEGSPLFVLECKAARVPVVATAVGGVSELVENGRTGLLVPPRDPAALAEAIERVLTNRELSARLAAEAASDLEQFEIASVARRFADLYRQLVADTVAPA